MSRDTKAPKRGGSRISTRLGFAGMTGNRMMPYFVPWLVCLAAMPVALLLHWAWHGEGVQTALLAAGATGLTLYVHMVWGRRHRHTQVTATAFTGAVSGWIVLAVASDPVRPGMVQAWLMGSLFLSVAWCVRHAALSPHHEDDKSGAGQDSLLDRVSALRGGRVRKVKETPGRVEAEIQMVPGEGSVGAVQAEKGTIASLAQVGENEVSVSAVSGRADRVSIAFQITEALRKSVKWTGPSAPGQSIAAAPLRPGERQDGKPLDLWLVGSEDPDNPRPLPHTLTTGVTGSGKTETVKTAIVDLRTRIDSVPIVADPEKFMQGFGDMKHALGLYFDGEEETHQFIRNLPDAIKYRASVFGSLTRADGGQGYSQWVPELWTHHGIPHLFVDVEEAATVLSGNDDFDQAIRTARSVGISLMASMTSAHHTNVDRKVRGQFTNSLCHGAVEIYDARFALSAGSLEAGADPTKWRNNYPGSLYAELVGTPPEEWTGEARAYYLSRQQKLLELDRSKAAGWWADIDEGTRAYLVRGIARYQADGEPPADDEYEEDEDMAQPYGEVSASALRTLDDGATVDITQPLAAPMVSMMFRQPEPVRLTTEQARAALEGRIDELEAAGKAHVEFADLAQIPTLVGRSRGWVYLEFQRLVEAGRLTSHDGKPPFYIRPRVGNGHRTA